MAETQRSFGYVPKSGELSLSDRVQTSKNRLAANEFKKRSDTPSSWDWRNQDGNSYVSSVKDQKQCGSCVSFGVTACIEVAVRLAKSAPSNKSTGWSIPDLSPADLQFCSSHGANCNGWNVTDALDYCKSQGVSPWSCCGYDAGKPACSRCATSFFQKTIVGDYEILHDVAAMKAFVSGKGALITCISPYDNFYDYKSGVYAPSGNPLNEGHCICVVGYDDNQSAWLCKNSWGTNWGEAGFFWIGYGECGVDATMWCVKSLGKTFVWPALDLGSSARYDSGVNPSVALNSSLTIEAHKSQGDNKLFSRTAGITGDFGGSDKYDDGWQPYVAVNDRGDAVEVHKSQSASTLWYHVGRANGPRENVNWSGSHKYDTGLYTAVGVNASGVVVELHQSPTTETIWYRVGSLDGSNINWGPSNELDTGIFPSIALNDHNQVVEVHQSPSHPTVWCRAGTVSGQAMNWGPVQKYDDGLYPCVALNSSGQIVEVHQAQSGERLWFHTGWFCPTGPAVIFGPSQEYDGGLIPRVAVNNGGSVREVHQSQHTLSLWTHASTLS